MESLSFNVLDHLASESRNALRIQDKRPSLGVVGGLVMLSLGLPSLPAQALLRRGDSCDAVVDLQQALLDQGFETGGVDGFFGGQTEYALLRFQEEMDLESDRIVGAETATALGLDPDISCPATAPDTETETEASVPVIDIPIQLGQVVTEGDPLNVRSGPGTDYSIVGTIPSGSFIRFVGQPIGVWLQLLEGGWIHSDWVVIVEPAGTASDAKAEDKALDKASSSDPSPAKAEPANAVEPTTEPSPTAATLEARGGPAISVDTDAENLSPAELQKSNPLWDTLQLGRIDSGDVPLNVRQSPSVEAEIIGQLSPGTQVTVLTRSDRQTSDWLLLTTGGWVSRAFVDIEETVASEG